MAKGHGETGFDRDLQDLAPEDRWKEWMRRIEAVLFSSSAPVSRADLAKVVGRDVAVDLLVEDLSLELDDHPFEVARVADGWILRTRQAYSATIQTALGGCSQGLDLGDFDAAVLAAIAYQQPITRTELKDIFGKDVSRELISRLHSQGLIGTGPRSPRPGAPYTYVTTDAFLLAFDLPSLDDLPDREQLDDAGLLHCRSNP